MWKKFSEHKPLEYLKVLVKVNYIDGTAYYVAEFYKPATKYPEKYHENYWKEKLPSQNEYHDLDVIHERIEWIDFEDIK